MPQINTSGPSPSPEAIVPLPCPRCASKVANVRHISLKRGPLVGYEVFVECDACSARGAWQWFDDAFSHGEREKSAIEKWNQRVPSSPGPAPIPPYVLQWIQERTVALAAANDTTIEEYEAQWAAEGNPVSPGDGYPLKVGDLRETVRSLLSALEIAGLYEPVVELGELPF